MNLFTILFGNKSTKKGSINPETEKAIIFEWKNIDVLLSTKGPAQLKNALISADKTLDNALRDMFEGESFADRMRNAERRFDKYFFNKIWEAHKLRNQLVHESGFEPPHFVLTEAVQTMKTAVQNLGVRI